MKDFRRIIFLFAILACAVQSLHAYEYFTIYFTDGTKSEAFYATDVDSIRYSKLDLDSVAYADWQVQEIWTVDSVYRYPLSAIDNLSFTDVDENKVAEDMAKVNFIINPLYLKSSSPEELSERIAGMTDINGVEKVWTDHQSLFVKLQNYGVISYSYPPKSAPSMVQNSKMTVHKGNKLQSSLQANEKLSHRHVDIKNVCVVRQMIQDAEFKDGIAESDAIVGMCKKWGVNVVVNDDPRPEFFVNGIRNYDLVFLMTHGLYNGSHWLATSEEIYSQTLDKPLDEDSLCRVAKEYIKSKYYDKGYSPNDITFSHLIENRNGVNTLVCYTWISNHFISKHSTPKSNNIVVFNTACQSMKGNNPELAEAFMKSGTACYSGFTESNRVGPWTNRELCERLLSGFSVYSAYQSLPDSYYQETFESPENSGVMVNPKLILWPENELTSICITHPETLSAEVTSNNDGTTIKLKGSIKTTDPGKVLVEGGGYGFQYSNSSDFSSYQVIDNDMLEVVNHDKNALTLSFETGNIESLLNRSTTYFYRAYINDGYSECYGDIKSFTTETAVAYAVLNEETLTFYYDNKKDEREGTVYKIKENYTAAPGWRNFTKAVFDASFANYRPTSTAWWFHSCGLKEIENIHNLNTSKVTDMSRMFSSCYSLTSLDLSSFDTSKVTNMKQMFCASLSLASLDLSGFDTSKVTDMHEMFYGCTSLTSLDLSSFNTSDVTDMDTMFGACNSLTSLDLSSFDTSKVTNMGGMFGGCYSLTSLDLSSFDTSKVTDMEHMFNSCNSLTSLSLSSFDTSKVTNMGHMFCSCTSLMSLDLSSFDTPKVTNMYAMFHGCSSLQTIYAGNWNIPTLYYDMPFSGCISLKGGMGTQVGTNLYGYDANGNALYYYCANDGSAAHIDGGKDNPGLFTAK